MCQRLNAINLAAPSTTICKGGKSRRASNDEQEDIVPVIEDLSTKVHFYGVWCKMDFPSTTPFLQQDLQLRPFAKNVSFVTPSVAKLLLHQLSLDVLLSHMINGVALEITSKISYIFFGMFIKIGLFCEWSIPNTDSRPVSFQIGRPDILHYLYIYIVDGTKYFTLDRLCKWDLLRGLY